MATQVTLNSGSVDSAGSLLLKTNGTTTAVTLDTSQNASFAGAITATTSVTTPFVTSAAATNLLLKSAGTTAITIDTSQNVCIGTSTALTSGKISLQADLSAVNAMTLRDSGTTYGVSSYYTLYQNSAGSTVGGIGHTAVTSLGINATTDLQFFTAASEKMRLDASGNLGLGVTPSAWGGGKAIDISTVTGLWSLSTQTHLISNGYYNGTNYIYKSTNAAADYAQIDNTHRWSIAPSGTAGNTISFTQAMTLDASGKLGIGVTSPDSRLHVVDPANAGLRIGYNSTSVNYYDADTQIFRNGASTERVRIAANGSFGVGPFDADVINSRTSAAAGNTRSLYTGWYNSTTPTNGTLSFNVTSNGNVTNTNNSYGPISDIKLKENIVDATPKLDDLMKVRIVNYNLKADLGYENHKQIGVIAQELEQVFAGLVDESPDKDEEGNALGTTTKSVKMTVFIPMLIKALQEQQSLIQSLTDRLTALEGAAK